MFEKIEVNGFHVHPLFDHLKKAKSGLLGPSIKWNFTKFLVDRNGKVVARHAPTTTPQASEERDRGPAVNDKTETNADQLPDRLCVDPRSPYYNDDVLSRDVGIRFKGVEKTNVEEYCVSEGWVRVTAGQCQGPPRQSADHQGARDRSSRISGIRNDRVAARRHCAVRSSCPGLTRASTPFFIGGKDVDGRDEPGHDETTKS